MKFLTSLHRFRPAARAFSLIEVIGVLAIMAIVAAVLAPNLARRLSRLNGEKEDQALAVLAGGLSRASTTRQVIPGAASWVSSVAAMTGLSMDEVRYVNAGTTRGERVYLIHPGFAPSNGANPDPLWTQTAAGASMVTNARLMLISCHKADLPLPLSSGKPASVQQFDALWNWNFNPATRSAPAGWPESWTGNGEYLHVQRINLAPLFHRVTFSNAEYPAASPSIQIGGVEMSLSSTSAVDAFYIQNTYLRLFKDAGHGGGLDLSQTLAGPINFLYESERWRVP
jgi:type II secretory pathway pseudopilin PulG